MGLLDILNTVQNTFSAPGGTPTGSRPQTTPGSAPGAQGMSPIAKALLALLAMYAAKNMRTAGTPPAGGTAPAGSPGGGGLGDILKGPLGGILGGAAAGTILNGGLGGLLKQLQDSGQGEAAHSWVGHGPNKPISQDDLANALGGNTLDQLTGQTGLPREQVLEGLSQNLPHVVDQLTPDGRLPTNEEAARLI